MRCPSCQVEIGDDSRFCSNCGTPIESSGKAPITPTKSLTKSNPELIPGAVLSGKYKILGELGRGGMGVVYRAEDTGLGRGVAIKVLPDVFSGDPERLARFEREAKVLASLNHPHIASIYGIDQAEGMRFLVLELVEGETLADRLSRRPYAIEEALEVCRQIAEGLECAHEKGIIHRDLKPSNVKITPEGKAKILDFGLARAFREDTEEVDIINSPTITANMTRPGVILGTAAYMSPEQAKGKTVDRKADIWAFGCVLYECLTGKQAFAGVNVTETLAVILKGEPDWQALPSAIPWRVKDLLHRCLKKEPHDRLHDIADARIEITEALHQPADLATAPAAKARGIWKAAALILGVTAIGMAIGIITLLHKTPAQLPVLRAAVELPNGMKLTMGGIRTEVAFSPDGEYFVFSASPDESSEKACLYRRSLSSAEAEPIPGTEGGMMPFFSPDGQWLGFWASTQNNIQRISLKGGLPVPICASGPPMGICWGPNGKIIYGSQNGLWAVNAEGGSPEALTAPDLTKEVSHRLPTVLPGGKAVIFTVFPHASGTLSHIEALKLESRERKVLIEEGADARFVPTGHLVYMREGTLVAVPFDPDRLEVKSPAVPVIAGVRQALNLPMTGFNSGSGQFHFSPSGSLIYASGGISEDPVGKLAWIDRQGRAEPLALFGERPVLFNRLSPDGRILAFNTQGKRGDLYIFDLARGTPTALTTEGRAGYLCWNPDGTRIAFSYSKGGRSRLFWMPCDGSRPMEPISDSIYGVFPASWSRDGRFLAVIDFYSGGGDISVIQMDSKQMKPFINTPLPDTFPEFSPDGKWLAYCSRQGNPARDEVFITEFPGPGRKILISNEGGTAPLWAPDGRELYYWSLDCTKLMVVDITGQPDLKPGKPHVLFRYDYVYATPFRNYAISPDGRRFLVREQNKDQGAEEERAHQITRLNFVQNWYEELKRLCPTDKK